MAKAKSGKTKAGSKDFAEKRTLNPGGRGGAGRAPQPPQEQDPKRRFGQFGGEGEPPLIKK